MSTTVIVQDQAVTVATAGTQGPSGQGVPIGGTSGQVLAKNSNTDFDTKWINAGIITGGAINSTPIGGTSAAAGAFTTLSASGIATFGSGQVLNGRVITASGAVTLTNSDYIIVINKTTPAATTVNLPSSPATWQTHIIKDGAGNANSYNITIAPAAGNIDGATTYIINGNGNAATVTYNGTQWNII